MKRKSLAFLLVLAFASFSMAEGRSDIIDEAPEAVAASDKAPQTAVVPNVANGEVSANVDAPAKESMEAAPCPQQTQPGQTPKSENESSVPVVPIVVSALATVAFVILAVLF